MREPRGCSSRQTIANAPRRWVGGWYGNGQGVAEDKAEALRWYRKAADLGDRSGMF
jgi:TPR repeat protein